ncbi:hypothetical protein B0H11DRAFT_1350846 [Mycena galericulata]|nr:hypothetical protein B0H11DRAFT_1350846 [Mycena galericulata]
MASKKTKMNAQIDSGLLSSYSSLLSLGAPVTLEEFTRLYQGPLADALGFLGEHIVGRQGAATARNKLFLLQEERSKSNLKQPDTTRSDAEKAVARLSSAKKSSEVYGSQLDDRQDKYHTTLAQADSLQNKLAHKRKLLLLLQVLEAKQTLRLKRIESMTKVIDDLRKAVKSSSLKPRHKNSLKSHAQSPPSFTDTSSADFLRISNVKDSMAGLHSCTVQVSRILKSPSSGNVLLRLREAIARSDPADATGLMDRCTSFAHAMAHQKIFPPLHRRSVDISDLEAIMQSNKEKDRKLQRLIDRSTALRLLCDHHVASISDFTEISSHTLQRSLQKESKLLQGHVDISRLSIVAERFSEPAEESFLILVTQVCQMHGNVRVRAILDEVERIIKLSYRRFNLVAPDRLPQPLVVHRNLIDTFRSDTQAAHDRATKLLSRKAEKAVMGRSLANDVETLLREARLAIGLYPKD